MVTSTASGLAPLMEILMYPIFFLASSRSFWASSRARTKASGSFPLGGGGMSMTSWAASAASMKWPMASRVRATSRPVVGTFMIE